MGHEYVHHVYEWERLHGLGRVEEKDCTEEEGFFCSVRVQAGGFVTEMYSLRSSRTFKKNFFEKLHMAS